MPLPYVGSTGQVDVVVPAGTYSANGDSGILLGYGAVARLVVACVVTAFSGTSPTLDVIVEDTLDGGANWFQVVAFTTFSGAGGAALRTTTPFSDTVRVRYAIGGSASPSFTFEVRIYSED